MSSEYDSFLHTLQANLVAAIASGAKLFETRASGLFDAYLSHLPDSERQYHTCSCCHRFVSRFGGLVTIDENGRTVSAIWNALGGPVPALHQQGVAAMAAVAEAAEVKGPFLNDSTVWGIPEAGGFQHMHVTPPASHVYRRTGKLTARQRMAELREEFGMLSRGLEEFSREHVRQATLVMQSNALYRSDRFMGPLQFLDNLHVALAPVLDIKRRANIIWRALAGAPAGYARPKSTVVGTLLEDVKAGFPFDALKSRFEAKVAPDTYQRTTAAPKAGNIEAAEKLFAELGLAPALARRYLEVNEAPRLWAPTAPAPAPTEPTGIVPAITKLFGHIVPAPANPDTPAAMQLNIPAERMTWAKFVDTILPAATSILAQVPARPDRFAALVTAVDPKAPNLLQWSNPVSWYYAAGVDGEFRRRVEEAGGQYDNVGVRATLLWNNRNDLDIFVYTPRGEEIYFGDRTSACGGRLDVDRNVNGETTKPIENVRWQKGSARAGEYQVKVWNYNHHEPVGDTPYSLELEVDGQTFRYDGVHQASYGLRKREDVVRFTLDGAGRLVGEPRAGVASSAPPLEPSQEHWGLVPGTWVAVRSIVNSPNTWFDSPSPQHHGEHTFFLLEGCSDQQKGRGRGFFNEHLRGDLREVRAVLDAYAKTAEIAPVDDPACGLGMVAGREWNLLLRAETPTGTRTVLVDRHD